MQGSIVIRLIDVVLILLFGFIAVSEVSQKTQIQLPESTQIPLSNPDKEEILIIGISSDGYYWIEEETKSIQDPQLVKKYILKKYQELLEYDQDAVIRVRIRSDRDAPAKYTLTLANICDQLNITKSIDVQRRGH